MMRRHAPKAAACRHPPPPPAGPSCRHSSWHPHHSIPAPPSSSTDEGSGCKRFYRCERVGAYSFRCPSQTLWDQVRARCASTALVEVVGEGCQRRRCCAEAAEEREPEEAPATHRAFTSVPACSSAGPLPSTFHCRSF